MTDIGDMIERGSDGPEWLRPPRQNYAVIHHDSMMAELAFLRAEVERLRNQASLFKIYMEALDRSSFDMSLCRVCGQPVVCLPDGLAVCEPCAKEE